MTTKYDTSCTYKLLCTNKLGGDLQGDDKYCFMDENVWTMGGYI